MKIRTSICLLLFASFLTRCENHSPSDCTNRVCTDVFMGISIHIKYRADDKPVTLTDYKVIRTSDNMDLTRKNPNPGENNGYYNVVDDSSTGLIRNSLNEVEFQGFIEDQMVVQNRFVIRPDCCHVYLVSGETEVLI